MIHIGQKYLSEFKNFAIKWNAVDLAIWVVIWTAFWKIVTSLVEDIFLPIIAFIWGKVDFSNLFFWLNEASKSATTLAEARKLWPVLAYGSTITITVNFLLVAGAIFFFVVKPMAKLREIQAKNEQKTEAKKAEDIQLLQDIKVILEKQNLILDGNNSMNFSVENPLPKVKRPKKNNSL